MWDVLAGSQPKSESGSLFINAFHLPSKQRKVLRGQTFQQCSSVFRVLVYYLLGKTSENILSSSSSKAEVNPEEICNYIVTGLTLLFTTEDNDLDKISFPDDTELLPG